MESLVSAYGDDDDHPSESSAPVSSTFSLSVINSAPPVKKDIDNTFYANPRSREVFHNPEFESLWAPVQGPSHPHLSKNTVQVGGNNILTGFVEDDFMNNYSFSRQFHSFHSRGVALAPNGQHEIGEARTLVGDSKALKRKREKGWDSANVEGGYKGPWGVYEGDERVPPDVVDTVKEPEDADKEQNEQPPAEKEVEEPKKEEEEEEPQYGPDGRKLRKKTPLANTTTTFHGQQLRDYQGRTFVDPPSDMKSYEHECFLPKKPIHTWTGHTKGVSAIRFFPKYGHLLLSASMDTTVKIWDTQTNRKCMRTYAGHTKAVRDITFTNDGRKFLSASYDRLINYWDTETGQCLATFAKGSMPYCVKFHPENDRQHIFVAGCSDKKIVQWDTRTGGIVQQYDQHLGAVNTITFIDDNKRFVSSSDDKSLRIWEWGIPVVIKYISEPHMHSMPSVALHPQGEFFAAQSLDNQIMIYGARNRFPMNRKKLFNGHVVAGYACQVNFSPDGHWIMSGDSTGKAWFWDWNTCRVLKSIKAHDGVCIGVDWHPIESSKVATCGWDGLIKYWD
eukprot:TRINITY_DN5717_c0_g1_i1.p1 TRINITY_DN5717_c0_g1~~TRINITY_DN5717_c0_g1_i1.p1  ORF type:complete len:562 (-),score=164.89 TRINITY_DN5717_c0_g1_i1:107-1792(-)